jgi:hypothetical protein
MLCPAQTGGRVKNKRRFFGGLKTRVIFYEKDKNRIAKLELIIIYKRRSYQSIYRGIYTGKLAGHISTVIQKKRNRKRSDVSLDSNLQANKILSP